MRPWKNGTDVWRTGLIATATPTIDMGRVGEFDSLSEDASERIGRAVSVMAAVLVLSCVGVALAFLPNSVLGIDAARLPKEAIVTLASLVLLCGSISSPGRSLAAAHWWMAAFIFTSTLSMLGATNYAVATRAMVISLASFAFLIGGSRVTNERFQTFVVLGVALAGGLAAVSVLLEAVGQIPHVSLAHHGPGGTFLHRNHAAHFMVCTLPAAYCLSANHGAKRKAFGIAVTACLATAILVTRCRSAWIGTISLVIVIWAASMFLSTKADLVNRRRHRQFSPFLWTCALGAGFVLSQPITRRVGWAEPNPMRHTLSSLVDRQSGSGSGRLLQYQNTMKMIASHWFLGVGPGNWAVNYPHYAPPNDPSLLNGVKATEDQPLSDWLGFASERGIVAFIALMALMISLLRSPRSNNVSDHALLGLITAVIILGSFDAVQLAAAPSAVCFTQFGVYAKSRVRASRKSTILSSSLTVAMASLLIVLLPTELALLRSNLAITSRITSNTLQRAVSLQPVNYTAQMLLAISLADSGHCQQAIPHIDRAIALYPFAPAPLQLARACT
jgi:putative inorganic carbon (HCO3(-)) transporter